MDLKELEELTKKFRKIPKSPEVNENPTAEWINDMQEGRIERARQDLNRFRLPLIVAIIGVSYSIIISSISLYYIVTDDKSELLKSQIELQRLTIQELQKSKEVLFRIEENSRQVEVKDTLVD